MQYTEPFNSRRTKYLDKLSDIEFLEYEKLCERYALFGVMMCMISAPPLFQKDRKKVPDDIEEFKSKISNSQNSLNLKSVYFRDLLNELLALIDEATDEFNNIFKKNIFAQQNV